MLPAPRSPALPSSFSFLPSSAPAPFSLVNEAGFWELTFNGRYATVPQHPALFCVAWLFAHPYCAPVTADHLAATVSSLFGHRTDLHQGMPWVSKLERNSQGLRVIRRKERSLEKVLDARDQPDVVKAEVLRELLCLYSLEKGFCTEIAHTAEATSEILCGGLRYLHGKLATATNLQGNPQPVLRAFARHLLLYLLIPSTIVSRTDPIARFIYTPPLGTAWSPWEKMLSNP
jgi:hypothetical protein